MTPSRIVFTLLSLLLVFAVATWELQQRSAPGPLHPAHAARPELTGPAGCVQCHAAGGASAFTCADCHADVSAQIGSGRGLHGAQPAGRDCGSCHREHHGAAAPLLDRRAFALAGVEDPGRYDHRHVQGFALHGAHQPLACDRCHPNAAAAAPPIGGRFLGLEATCTGCHDDAHRGGFGGDCEQCHGQQQPFRDAPGFDHGAFPLRGAHARQACVDCHASDSPWAVTAPRAQPAAVRRCADCHRDPHQPAADGGLPAALPFADSADCGRCHPVTTWRDACPDAAAHARFGFPLRGVHARAACTSCHGAAAQPRRDGDGPVRPEQCSSCHASPHRPQFVAANVVAALPGASDCAGCHLDEHSGFGLGIVTAAQHAASGFPLTPPHAAFDCQHCHGTKEQPWAERFPGRAAADCRACHRDVHGGQFEDAQRTRQCTGCHETSHFLPPRFDAVAHAAVAFPLTGAHEAVACTLCHAEVHDGVRRFRGTPQQCADCHRDPHARRFDRPGLPAIVGGRSGCARCHDTKAFAPVAPAPFDHAAWTGHVLRGAHAAVACTACHPATKERRLGPAAGTQCADCHRDPHLGQFLRDGSTDCSRCHGEDAFDRLRFDHQRDSRFPLDGNHRTLACSACHKPQPTRSGPVVRYAPLGTRCGDCHVLQRGQVGRR